MPLLSFEEYLDLLARSGKRLAEQAATVAPTTPVPTCPRWSVTDLLAHQAMVHRWATAKITGGDPDAVPSESWLAAETRDLPTYYREGLDALLAALRAAPPDLKAVTFLNDAPPPREFWARRQAHETTIHSVDAVAAVLGRAPRAGEVEPAVGTAVAVDGLDELLRGFVTRGRNRIVVDRPVVLEVRPDDAIQRWSLRIGESVETTRAETTAEAGDRPADAVFTGTAEQLYLGMWNRGEEIEERTAEGAASLLPAWRAHQVQWS